MNICLRFIIINTVGTFCTCADSFPIFCCLVDEKIKLKILACSFEITVLTNFENLAHFPCSQCLAFVEDGNNQLNCCFFTGLGTD
jgi:hypothetical protein